MIFNQKQAVNFLFLISSYPTGVVSTSPRSLKNQMMLALVPECKEGDFFFWTNDIDKGVGYLFEDEGKLFVQFTHYQREGDYWRKSSDRAPVSEYEDFEVISETRLNRIIAD